MQRNQRCRRCRNEKKGRTPVVVKRTSGRQVWRDYRWREGKQKDGRPNEEMTGNVKLEKKGQL